MCRSYTSAPWRKVSAADVLLMPTQSPTGRIAASRPFHRLSRNAIGCAACKIEVSVQVSDNFRTSGRWLRPLGGRLGSQAPRRASGAAPWRSFSITSAKTYGDQASVAFPPALKHCEQCIGAQPKLGSAGALPMLLISGGSCQPGLDLGSDDRALRFGIKN